MVKEIFHELCFPFLVNSGFQRRVHNVGAHGAYALGAYDPL